MNVKLGSGLLYMKVGTHAKESLESILRRKTKEIEEAGLAFWGYGGSTCHPCTMVQPFAKNYEKKGEVIQLVMEPINSNHFAEPVPADEYSVDGRNWQPVPRGVRALGSRYALVIGSLNQVDIDLPLSQTRVALGNSSGRSGADYIRGRVDKACLEITSPADADPEGRIVHIGLVAELKFPYAVFLRNTA